MDINKKELVVDDSVDFFRNGLYCSEAIFKSFRKNGILDIPEEVLKIATGFGVGIGASKCCCGSLTGGVLVLSVLLGRTNPGESDKLAMESSAKLYGKFKDEFGASCCKVLTRPVEWGAPEHHVYCERFVKKVAEDTYGILEEYGII
jgi:C_GCAxxG_C_C family probable redox protein